jgi:glutamate formiminotransferase/formiminotetrahydrofolate cyclodeaminase
MAAFGMPKGTEAESAARSESIQVATRGAMEVPLRVMQVAAGSMEIIKAMAETGNPNSASDAGVGALCARAAVRGAGLNVRINASGLKDQEFVSQSIETCEMLESEAELLESEILKTVAAKL